jgi:hypothetical protein
MLCERFGYRSEEHVGLLINIVQRREPPDRNRFRGGATPRMFAGVRQGPALGVASSNWPPSLLGVLVNRKPVQRIWRKEGLHVPPVSRRAGLGFSRLLGCSNMSLGLRFTAIGEKSN